jgi:NADPH:quinone reductase-like Zn-dependent oxidoreductase
VRRLTGKKGVEVVFEHTGAQTWPGSINSLAKNGRLVTCGATSGYDAPTDLRQVFYRHVALLGSFMGSKAELLDAMKFVERGQIRAVVTDAPARRSPPRARTDGGSRAVRQTRARPLNPLSTPVQIRRIETGRPGLLISPCSLRCGNAC